MSGDDGSITFSIDPERRVRIALFNGVVDDTMLLSAYGALVAEPDYDPTVDDLVDMRGTTRLQVSKDTLRRIIAMYEPVDQLGVPTRLAIVAPNDYTFGISRMYELLRGNDGPETVRVFRCMEEAHEWLAGDAPS